MEARQLPRIGRGSKVPCTLAGFQCRERVEEEEEEARALNGTSVYGRIPTFTVLGPSRYFWTVNVHANPPHRLAFEF